MYFLLIVYPLKLFRFLQAGTINNFCQLVDPEGLNQELSHLKSLNVDGVVVDCWWGIVENWSPQKYLWSGYRDLFTIIRQSKLRIQVNDWKYLDSYSYYVIVLFITCQMFVCI